MIFQHEERPILNDWPNELLSDALNAQLDIESSRDGFNTLLESINAKLPPDYLEFIKHVGGAKIFGWMVFGLAEIRKIVYPRDNYYILAEKEGKATLAVKEGGHDAEIYLLGVEDGEASKLGKSFKKALVNQRALPDVRVD